SQEQPPGLPINGHTAGRGAWRSRPALFDGELVRVNLQDLALVFQVVEDKTLPVGDCEFRTAFQVNGSGNFASRGIDRRRAVAAAIEGEYARCDRVVNDGV